MPKGDGIERIIKAWANGQPLELPKKQTDYHGKPQLVPSMRTDGVTIWSYFTRIAHRYPDGTIVLSNQTYTATTTRQQRALIAYCEANKLDFDYSRYVP